MTARRLLWRRAMNELDDIAQAEITEGWDVLDGDGELIGQVGEVHTGSFSVDTTVGGSIEVAFTDIESADDGRVTLMLSGDELTSDLGG